MFEPDADEACASCSFWIDSLGHLTHLHARDYARGIDLLNGTYNWLDLTARGRQEDWEQPPGRGDDPALRWVRRHDSYEPDVIGGASAPE